MEWNDCQKKIMYSVPYVSGHANGFSFERFTSQMKTFQGQQKKVDRFVSISVSHWLKFQNIPKSCEISLA